LAVRSKSVGFSILGLHSIRERVDFLFGLFFFMMNLPLNGHSLLSEVQFPINSLWLSFLSPNCVSEFRSYYPKNSDYDVSVRAEQRRRSVANSSV
jgi:hypothetical protein